MCKKLNLRQPFFSSKWLLQSFQPSQTHSLGMHCDVLPHLMWPETASQAAVSIDMRFHSDIHVQKGNMYSYMYIHVLYVFHATCTSRLAE